MGRRSILVGEDGQIAYFPKQDCGWNPFLFGLIGGGEGKCETAGVYPVMLDVRDRPCLVVGAGAVGTRKVEGLLAQGATVTVVSPELSTRVQTLREDGRITVDMRAYVPTDLDGCWLVIAATGNETVNQSVYDDAQAARVWSNCADEPDRCAFILPAVHRDGQITISVSTGGASPSLAKWLRDRLADALPGDADALAAALADKRRQVQAAGGSTEDIDWRPIIDELHGANSTPESSL